MVESNASCSQKCNRHTGVASPEKGCSISRRRRHKTVHFGDNLLLQVCANANITSHMTTKMEPNVQQLFSFIEAVLSAWVTEEGLTSQGEVSEADEKTLQKRRYKKHCDKVKRLDIKRLAAEVSKLNGTRFLGAVRFRHVHWKGKPNSDGCNEFFLRKVHLAKNMSAHFFLMLLTHEIRVANCNTLDD